MAEIHKTLNKSIAADNRDQIVTIPSIFGIPKQYFLTSAGDGTGNFNLTGDYSAAPTDFYIEFPYEFHIRSILINIAVENKVNLDVYGSVDVGLLTNGVKFYLKPPGLAEIPLFAGIAFKSNKYWYLVTQEPNIIAFEDTLKTARVFPVNIDLFMRYGSIVAAPAGTQVIVRLQDDFSGLIGHSFNIGGTEYTS